MASTTAQEADDKRAEQATTTEDQKAEAEEGKRDAASVERPQQLFPEVGAAASADEEQSPVTSIESLCANCEKQGTTRLLLTRIPHFREVVLMSFECPHCGFRNNEVQYAGQLAECGVRYVVRARSGRDVQRSVVLSDTAAVGVPELELEIPASGRGRFTTIEGVLTDVAENLRAEQAQRFAIDADAARKVDAFVARLEACKTLSGEFCDGFSLRIDDPAGNSHVETFDPHGGPDASTDREHYVRTRAQNERLGLHAPAEAVEEEEEEEEARQPAQGQRGRQERAIPTAPTAGDDGNESPEQEHEVLAIACDCPMCGGHGESRMHVTSIPYFKEVVVMAFACEHCGYKSSEIKPGAAIAARGRRTTLRVTNAADLSRDLLKSDTASLAIPQVELELEPGTLGGKFTTVEGVIRAACDALRDANPFSFGDAALQGDASRAKFRAFFDSVERLLSGDAEFDVVLDDPAGNSYIQNVYAPEADPSMRVEEYERTREQNEELGLLDMNTESGVAV